MAAEGRISSIPFCRTILGNIFLVEAPCENIICAKLVVLFFAGDTMGIWFLLFVTQFIVTAL